MGLSEARRCYIWYNAHTKSKGEFVVKEALREVMSQFYTDGVPTDAIGRQRRLAAKNAKDAKKRATNASRFVL